ncbi:MAG: hypothetical protein QN209_08915, partial [Armatimonadota bacterium]|nr:hypothetical protein [Armatimonadota bacterium]
MRSQLARILLLSVLLVGLTGPVWGPAPEGAVPTESATCLPGVEVTGGIALPAALAAGAPPTVKVGYSAPFTGAAAEFGTNGWRGIQLALEEI